MYNKSAEMVDPMAAGVFDYVITAQHSTYEGPGYECSEWLKETEPGKTYSKYITFIHIQLSS